MVICSKQSLYLALIIGFLLLSAACVQIEPPITRPAISPSSPLATPIVLSTELLQREFSADGFTLRYPATATLSAGQAKGDLYQTVTLKFALPEAQGYQGMTIRVEPNPDNLSVAQIIANLYEQMSLSSPPPSFASHIESITVAGKQAYKTDILPDSTAFHIFILDDEKIYTFALVYGLTSNGSSPEAERMFDEVMRTLILH